MKSVVLLSGGVDSALLLAERSDDDACIAVSFDYEQTHRRELQSARRFAAEYGVEHRIVGLSCFLPSALTGLGAIPEGHAEQPDATVVPGRNMVMLSVGISIADAMGFDTVAIGCNADDAAGYPDCRQAFIATMHLAAQASTDGRVAVMAPYLSYTKRDVVAAARRLQVPLEWAWSCYRGGDIPCGQCGACASLAAAEALV